MAASCPPSDRSAPISFFVIALRGSGRGCLRGRISRTPPPSPPRPENLYVSRAVQGPPARRFPEGAGPRHRQPPAREGVSRAQVPLDDQGDPAGRRRPSIPVRLEDEAREPA